MKLYLFFNYITMAIETFWNEEINNNQNEKMDHELSELNKQVGIELIDLKNDWWDWPKKKRKQSENKENEEQDTEKEKDKESEQKPEKSFTFKPISMDVWASTIKNWEEWADGITTKLEFAWWAKNLSLYGYIRKDWNKYAKWFNEWMELFGNETLKLWKNINLNGKQFYRWNWSGRLMAWPQLSFNKQLWSRVEVWGTAWAYATYDIIPEQKNQLSWAWIFSVNIDVEQKDGKKWSWDAFLNIGWIKNFNYDEYFTYWEANIKTPNLLDSEKAWALCWWIFARYWWNVKQIKLSCAWMWLIFKF